MKSKISNIYNKIVMSEYIIYIWELYLYPDPYIKSNGRPNKYEYDFYLNHIYNIILICLAWTA